MKSIKTNGGPLVAIPRSQMADWLGTDGTRFIGEKTCFASDYEAACQITNGLNVPPCDVAKIAGVHSDAVVFTMPFETACISVASGTVYFAQVEYAEEAWSFSQIDPRVIASVVFGEEDMIIFDSISDTYVVFDAALPGEEIGSEFIDFDAARGIHKCEVAHIDPDADTSLYIIKISALL